MNSLLFKSSYINMYFKKLKLFNSETLETYQMVKIAEILSSSIVLWKHIFLEWNKWTWKSYILWMIKNVYELESQLFNMKFQEYVNSKIGWMWWWKNVKNELNEIFWRTQTVKQEQDENIEKIIEEASIEVSKQFSKFDSKELQNEVFKDVDENLKQLYVHIRTNYNNYIFSYIDLTKISENLLYFNQALTANIELADRMKYKNKLVFLLDNIWNFEKDSRKETWLIIKEFSDKWIQFIITWSKQEKKDFEHLLWEMLHISEIDLKLLSDQISEEIIESHEWLKKDPWLAQLINSDKQKMIEMVNRLRDKYKKFEPSFSSEIVSDLYNQYQRNKIDQIKNTLNTWWKFNLSNLNLTQIQKFDILWTINKKYQETKIYTSEDKENDIKEIKKVLIWQDTALEWSMNAIFLWKWFNKNPIATLMYLWPTWVWKSELAKQIAKFVFNDENKIKVLQMNTFWDQWTASRLIWAWPWYVWYEDWKTQSLKAILEEMWEWVVLFDEIEKAHSSIYDFIMWMMWDWKVQMASWLWSEHELSFKNFILIFTSNAITSYDELKLDNSTIWFRTWLEKKEEKELDLNSWDVKERVIRTLKELFKSEFLWRIDQFFLFNELTDESMKTIIKNYIEKTKAKLKDWIKDWYSPFKPSDIDAFLLFDDQEIDDIILYAKKTKLWARNAIKKCEEIISEKMNFHFSWKTPSWPYKLISENDEENEWQKKRWRKKHKENENEINW